jgi:hypothetical protein
MSIPIITLKDINLLDRICIVDDAPLEIPSILLEDFDIVKQETRGYVYTKPQVIEYYERMFPKMRVRSDDHFQESKLLDWLQKLRGKEKYRYNKHVLVLDLCCTEKQLTSMFIEKLVEVIHNFGEIIFMMTVPSSFEKHNLFHKFDRIILGQHIPSTAPLWETLGDDVRKYYSNTARGHKFLTWNVKGGKYEMLDVNYHPPAFIQSNTSQTNTKTQSNTRANTQSNNQVDESNTQSNTLVNQKNVQYNSQSTIYSDTQAEGPSVEKDICKIPVSESNKNHYEPRDDCVIL